MSFKSYKYDRPSRQPAILSRKRKAENDIDFSSSPSEIPSSPISTLILSCDNTPSSSSDVDSDEKSSQNTVSPTTFSEFRGLARMKQSFKFICNRKSPLPDLKWAEQKDMWHSMVLKDIVYPRDHKVLKNHPELEPRMRAILLDWLTEVCEVYRLHRETFYLAQDYVDRFLVAKPNLPRNCLQLLGATALFVASKMEEIYPPKLDQFAYVTDGACTGEDILTQELILIMTLNWNLSPVTVINWLNIFMQLAHIENAENLIGPEKFPKNMFIQICQVLDLCILDIESLKFSYSVLSASAIAHFISKETAIHVSGLSWDELLPCVTWLKPFVETAFENGGADLKHFSDVSSDDWYNIQTHSAGLKLLDKVQQKQKLALQEFSPSTNLRQLTPPLSNKKMNSFNIIA